MAIKKRVSRQLNNGSGFNKIEDIRNTKISKDNLVDVLLSIEDKDICTSLIMNIFGEFDGKALCNPYDTLVIPEGLYGKIHNKPNKNKFTTTVGLWIFNKHFIEPRLFKVLGYVNYEIGKKNSNKINKILSQAVLEDEIATDDLADYLMKTQEFMKFETILTPNHSEELLTCTKKINVKKQQLLKKHDEKIKAGDPVIIEQIEKELLDYAKQLLGDDPAMDIFTSGALGNFGNHFKNTYISKGAVMNPDPTAEQKYNIITSNYMDGINREEYSKLANSLAAGPYARGKKTEAGGYWEKLLISGCQHVIAGPEGSDCGTKRYIEIVLDNDNIDHYMYNYIISGSSLVELTSKNRDKYLNKKVKLRFSSMCESKEYICSKCAGNLWYRLGIKNIGLLTAQVASKLKNISMKSFHDSVVTTAEMDPMKAFSIKK